MKVLVTGSSGYIGKHVVKELIDQGFQVIVNDLCYKNLDSKAVVSEANIFSDQSGLYEKLGSPDVIVHLAWQDGFIHDSNMHMFNLSKHYQFLHNMIESGCKNIAVMGTMHEVGYWEGPVDENTPCNPLSQYGVAKNALRQALILLNKQFDFNLFWLRAFYIFGDDSRASSIFAKIVQAEKENKKYFPFTTGKNKYDFISIDELAYQIARASTQTKVTGIINVCSGRPTSLSEQVESFIKSNNLKIKLQYGAFEDRPYDSPAIWGDNKKIKRIMSFKN